MATTLMNHYYTQHPLDPTPQHRPNTTYAHLRARTLLEDLDRIQQQADLFSNNEQDPYYYSFDFDQEPGNKSTLRNNRRPSLPFVPDGNAPSQNDWYAGRTNTVEALTPQPIHNITRSSSIKSFLKKRPSIKVNIPSPIKLMGSSRRSSNDTDDRSNSSNAEDTDHSFSTSPVGANTIPTDIFKDWNYDELPPMIKKKFFSPLERMRIAESVSERLSSADTSSSPSATSSVIEVFSLPYLRPKASTASFSVIKPPAIQVDTHIVPAAQVAPATDAMSSAHAHPHEIITAVTLDATKKALFYNSASVRHMLRTYFSDERFDEMIELGFPLDNENDADGFDADGFDSDEEDEDEEEDTLDNQSLPMPVRPSFPRKFSSRRRVSPRQRCMTLRITLTPWHCRAGEGEIYGRRESTRVDAEETKFIEDAGRA
ncbi:hypothetical protein BC937DRAFT_88080 [Endogone sp. FLAS-F59071]|nr:hypothetical protein BC937DRAFT_88080 [Endogone sp. FLAS-F59071]|eukprot:RUS19006.1 hypothetical protein BC937DRAFT_88080 [Endogone sp. FLAS-F59071]